MGFAHEYTYQDCEYRIRTMNISMHRAQCHAIYLGGQFSSLAPQDCLSSPKYSVIKLVRQC